MTARAYYNEIEPYAADWLRNLIAAGHIAPGDVDTRDIRDVSPDDLRGYTQCHFFAGIGIWSYALRRSGWPDDRPVWTGSCPCQPFSAAGRGDGFADERHLLPHWFHLIDVGRPAEIFGEQVASKAGLAWLDLVQSDLEGAGYAFGAQDLCAAGVGAPHIRQRLYFVATRHLANHVGRRQRVFAGPAQPRGRLAPAGHACAPGVTGRLADDHDALWGPDCPGWDDTDWPDAGRPEGSGNAEGRCEPIRLADDDDDDDDGRDRVASARLYERRPGTSGREPTKVGTDRARGHDAIRRSADDSSVERPWSRPTDGFWGTADWLFCTDAKWRPVEPGTQPLVDGAPARVGRLRAYGNAIVSELAQNFVETFLESEAAGHRELVTADADLVDLIG